MADNSLSGYEASNKRSALVVLAANQKPIFDNPPRIVIRGEINHNHLTE